MSKTKVNQSKAGVQFDIERAILNGKPSIKIEGKTIKLPSPQRTGTYAQQTAYASQAATKLTEDNFKFE